MLNRVAGLRIVGFGCDAIMKARNRGQEQAALQGMPRAPDAEDRMDLSLSSVKNQNTPDFRRKHGRQ